MTLIGWLACSPEPPSPPPPADPGLVELAEQSGYVVGPGAVQPFDYGVCCDPGASCLHNNPSTPYQFVHLPPAPDQVEPEWLVDDEGRAWFFHLRPDEAVVQIGRTPPTRYFGWQSYLVSRSVSGERDPVLGSLGPSVNNLVVAARHELEDPRREPFAVVTTMDAAVEREVVGWLLASGTDPWRIHVDRIPPALTRPGLAPEDDTFLLMIRAAMFDSAGEREAWIADAEMTVYRITPTAPAAPPREPHPVQPLPPQGTGVDEGAWLASVDALGQAIRAAYPDRTGVEGVSQPAVFPTYACLEDGCAFETRDRYYAALPPISLPEDHFVVAYGVNHARSGKATYANVSVNAEINHLGLDSVESDEMVGSARVYLPDDPLADDLYAVVIARSCAPFSGPCIEVTEGCPGVALDGQAKVDFRAYLEPSTGSGPLHTELVPDRALLFGPLLPAGP